MRKSETNLSMNRWRSNVSAAGLRHSRGPALNVARLGGHFIEAVLQIPFALEADDLLGHLAFLEQ